VSEDDWMADVVQLPSADPLVRARNEREAELEELPVRTAPHTRSCPHRRTYVSREARTLKCRDCGVDVDPIETLAELASGHEHLMRSRRYLRGEIDRQREQLDRLKRDERNAKSRIRGARRRRDDRGALIEAAKAAGAIGGYRGWSELSDPQREAVLEKMRAIVEAYAGALAELEQGAVPA
jgi:hypothetical protein